jgi:hypothetical protein
LTQVAYRTSLSSREKLAASWERASPRLSILLAVRYICVIAPTVITTTMDMIVMLIMTSISETPSSPRSVRCRPIT